MTKKRALREQIRASVANNSPVTIPVPGGEIVLTPKRDGTFVAEVRKDVNYSLTLDDVNEAEEFIRAYSGE
ncbi:hypothetical protein [Nocardioides zhouii]|uniref:Uncharacterized protein n=1 Tax=Nocardioides zhouii TaxID=1168729 RepID=A0A4Q2SNU2_9ACTN|nr:hypothetical protein [Nocardioides zhouii]RYC05748.1 hypothetical protein EUA94_17770 [Nocardioides zhouii]